jgi:hypothetical protein
VPPSPIPTPSPTVTTETNLFQKQNCVSGESFKKECFDFPKWQYEICLGVSKGELQQKVSGKWIKKRNVIGVKNSEYCGDTSTPFFLSIRGTSERSTNFQLKFYATSKYSQSFVKFNVKTQVK